MELGRLFGLLHPALVHFPLVLLLFSFGLETVGFFRRDEQYLLGGTDFAAARSGRHAVRICVRKLRGDLGGERRHRAGTDGAARALRDNNELAICLSRGGTAISPFHGAPALDDSVSCLHGRRVRLLVITGHKGAMLVYQHGAGVQLGAQPRLPTHDDLAVLRQKQDLDALFYSNSMHHSSASWCLSSRGLLLTDML